VRPPSKPTLLIWLAILVVLLSANATSFGINIHQVITRQALTFLRSAVLKDINDENPYQDIVNVFNPVGHFGWLQI
jgi:hypothetical protein